MSNISLNPNTSNISFTETIQPTQFVPSSFVPSDLASAMSSNIGNGQEMSPEMMSAMAAAQEQAKQGDQTLYCNVDDEGYILSVYQTPLGSPEGTPWVESIEEFDLSGNRIRAHKYDGENHTLIWDQEHYDYLIEKEKSDRAEAERIGSINTLKNRYTGSHGTETSNEIDVDALINSFEEEEAATVADVEPEAEAGHEVKDTPEETGAKSDTATVSEPEDEADPEKVVDSEPATETVTESETKEANQGE